MKYLLVAIVVMVAIGIWRNNRRKEVTPPPQRREHIRKAEQMVTCAHCGVHLPASDAVTTNGQQHYCCNEHRRIGPH